MAMVAVAVIAEKVTVEPIAVHVMATEMTQTSHAALMVILRFKSLRKKVQKGRT